ncbi:MAG: hypothetical protein AAFU65_05035 [Pseudomonadota bacterium]
MSSSAENLAAIAHLSPKEAAAQLASGRDDVWLDRFSAHLDRQRSGQSLERMLTVWGLSQADAARLFGVSRQAIGKWLSQGVPTDRAVAIADLSAATDVLVHHLKRDRIAAVVRRAAPALDDRSLLDMVGEGRAAEVLLACRRMFDFGQAHT